MISSAHAQTNYNVTSAHAYRMLAMDCTIEHHNEFGYEGVSSETKELARPNLKSVLIIKFVLN